MSHQGDFALGSTFDLKFTSRSFTTGAPFSLSGGVISAYPDNSVTQLTAGITLTADFDAVTGLNNVRVVATSGNGYASGVNYALVITTGTVNGVSVVGEVIGEFSIEARSALRPATAGRTLVVDAAGLADANTVKLGPTGAGAAQTARDIGASVLLSSGTGAGQLSFTAGILKVDVDTIKTNPVVNAGTITFPTTATLASTTNITAGTITTVSGNVNGSVASVTAGVTVTTNNDKTGYTLSSAGVQAVWDALTSALTTVGSVGKRIADFLTGDAFVRLGAPAGASVSVDVASIKTDTGTTIPGRLPAALVGGRMDSSVGSIVAGTIVSGSFAAGAFDAVWDVSLASHLTAGTTGAALNASGGAGDPWTTTLPGAYGAGTAGFIVGTNLDALMSSRLATSGYTAPLSAAGTRAAVGLASANLDTQLGGLGTQITGLNDITVAEIIAGVSEGSLDLQEILRIILAACAGKSNSHESGTPKYRDLADTKNRISATTDVNGNRTAITLDGS